MIRLEHIAKSYKDGKDSLPVLTDINMDLPDTGFVILTGPSGCGKSTLLNILAFNTPFDEGKYFFFSKMVKKISSKRITFIKAKMMGMVFQNYHLINDLTVIENIALASGIAGFSKKESYRLSLELLRKMNLSNFADKKTYNLSGGEAQRVALARALINTPPIILADEPTGALDEENKKYVMEILKEYSKSKLVVMVTHDLPLAKLYADRLVTISNGIIIKDEQINQLQEFKINPPPFVKNKTWWLTAISKRKPPSKRIGILPNISISFGLICGLLVFGFQQKLPDLVQEASLKMLDSNTIRVAKKYSQEVSGSPLTLVRYQAPQSYEIESLNRLGLNIIQEPSFSALFPESIPFKINGIELENLLFTPVFSFKNSPLESLLMEGIAPTDSLDNVVINTKAAQLIGEKIKENIVGKSLEINYEYVDENNSNKTRDTFVFNRSLKVSAIVNEFDFFSQPRVYYSVIGAKRVLAQELMINNSIASLKEISWYQRLIDALPNEPITNYERMIYPLNQNSFEIITNISTQENNKLETEMVFSSNYLTRLNLMNQVSNAGINVAYLFIIILLVGSGLIQGVMVYHWLVENRLDFAILVNLGAPATPLIGMTLKSLMLNSFYCSLWACLITDNIVKFGNRYFISNFNIGAFALSPFSPLYGIPFFGLIISTFIGGLTIVVASSGPLSKLKMISVAEELTQE